MKMEISKVIFSYEDLRNGLDLGRDDYGIAALCTTSMKTAFLNNPNLIDYSQPFLYLGRVDGIAGGICMWFPTRLKAGEEFVSAESGSTLEVYEEFRKNAFGIDILQFPITSGKFHFLIYAGISEQALKIYKKMRFSIFEFPRSMQLRNARPLLESRGLNGVFSLSASIIINSLTKCWYKLSNLFNPSYNEYKVVKCHIIPEWVDDIVLNDGHKYMEVHDRNWLQWNLDHNFYNEKYDKQSFYSVYFQEKPIAFFMTKERFRSLAGGVLKNVVIGSIMEWGVAGSSQMTETDLYKMATKTFSKSVDIIEFATTDKRVIKQMKFNGFIPYSYAHIAIKDLTRKYKDAQDMNLWRLRLGYADVFLT